MWRILKTVMRHWFYKYASSTIRHHTDHTRVSRSHSFMCVLVLVSFLETRRARLPAINMDAMFASVWGRSSQIHKHHGLINYFKRVCESMPQGTISYERKVLPRPNHKVLEPAFWRDSHTALCSFESLDQGIIEDAGWEYAQVDFADKFLGVGCSAWDACRKNFMLSLEFIVGMLFLPAMAESETIEITGSERFSNYAGHAGKFRCAGDIVDSTPRDAWGRHYTKIIAMDAKARREILSFGRSSAERGV